QQRRFGQFQATPSTSPEFRHGSDRHIERTLTGFGELLRREHHLPEVFTDGHRLPDNRSPAESHGLAVGIVIAERLIELPHAREGLGRSVVCGQLVVAVYYETDLNSHVPFGVDT